MGQVSYEYYHPEDIQKMVQLHNDGVCVCVVREGVWRVCV